jgi:hypothetical protein
VATDEVGTTLLLLLLVVVGVTASSGTCWCTNMLTGTLTLPPRLLPLLPLTWLLCRPLARTSLTSSCPHQLLLVLLLLLWCRGLLVSA